MSYKIIHTSLGLQLLAQSEAAGTPINLTHVAVGDGNGNPVTPSEGQTQLVRERYRTTVNTVYQDPDNPAMFTVEVIIPVDVGGFVMREIGVFDANGNLFVVGNLPEAPKPTAADGAFSDTVLTIPFMVGNAAEITLLVDPNIVVATRKWILNTITVAYLLPGGTTGQTLRKLSNNPGDVGWGDPGEVNVSVSSIEEVQTLAATQTVIDWAQVTNTGLAVYIEGDRLRGDQWTPDPNINTRIILKQSYAAGTKIVGAQNEPAGRMPDPLEKSKNLADMPDKTLGRANLGVYSKAESNAAGHAGAVMYFARNSAPTGWMKANGAAVSRTAYAPLFAAIGTTFGAGDGFNTFNLPDLRGEFVRGWDDGRGVDAGRTFGSQQSDDLKSHSHSASSDSQGSHSHGLPMNGGQGQNYGTAAAGDITSVDKYLSTNAAGAHSHNISVAAQGGPETRPRNRALLACIKY